ncbi:MAG: DNA (cytosine-5-)-methyltransferase [Pirellulaceae bacterium]|jgi:DNA (cytosine-5)-methyltransferase 1|nr:DNA (cytosine-5-)-methyltransferase [Pirellulaceae bacterium]MDP7016273.1 DNA (cytosine-5-)-methyltransferase [Pirellulaceae bacterium]
MDVDKSYLEFFAGIGLVHQALQRSGWRCEYANDIDEKKAQMYEDQFGSSPHFHLGDVWEIDDVLARISNRPFLATASFPCTDMSLAGHQRGFDGAESSAFFGFVEVIKRLGDDKPAVLMLENVLGFLTARGGGDFRAAVELLGELGYFVDAIVLDAKHFVPQSRPRLFVFGYAHSLANQLIHSTGALLDDPWLRAVDRVPQLRPRRLRQAMNAFAPQSGWATLALPSPGRPDRELDQVIDQDGDQNWWDRDQVERHYEMMSDLHKEEVDRWRRQEDPTVATIYRRVRQGQQRAEVRSDGVAGCLRTPRGGSARQIVLVAGDNDLRMRWMSPREYARLQGADEFAIRRSESQALFGFGDAVCVPVVEWIDQHILTPLFESAT